MSAVLCLPACLCVSAAASRGEAPHGNASVRYLPSNALIKPGGRPRGTSRGRPHRLSIHGGPPPTRGYHHLCAAPPGAPHSRTTDPGRPRRRVDLAVQLPPARPGTAVGPAPRLGTHAHRFTDRPPTSTHPWRPDTSRPATERRRPQHPATRRPCILGKQHGQGEGAKPPDDHGALQANGMGRGHMWSLRNGTPPAQSPWWCWKAATTTR